MSRINRFLCFVFFALLVFFYLPPKSFGDDDLDELRRQVRELQEKLGQSQEDLQGVKQHIEDLEQDLPDQMRGEAESAIERDQRAAEKKRRQEELKDKRLKRQWTAATEENRWSMQSGPKIYNLQGRQWVMPGQGYQGSQGVLFDYRAGVSASTGGGAQGYQIYTAEITPFFHMKDYGAEMVINGRSLSDQQVIEDGELRSQVSKKDVSAAYAYARFINKEKLEVVGFVGEVQEPFVREVVDVSAHSNQSILDKYRLNDSMAVRVDIGLGRMDNPNPRVVERTVWIQAAAFNLDEKNNFDDFAVRVMMSLAIINQYAGFNKFNLAPFQVWGGVAQVNSGTPPVGDLDTVHNPALDQEMSVFGFSFNLNELSGSDLGIIYGEFVKRVQTGEISDQSWVIGYEVKFTPKEEGQRPVELGIRYQNQQDDPDANVSDGQVIQGSLLYPLAAQNVAVRINGGYVIKSTDPDRDGELIFTTDLELTW